MLPARSRPARIAPLRPLRPPAQPVPVRPFTQNTQLLLLAHRHTPPRPQLPYLHQQTVLHRQTLLGPNQQIARLLSNETRQYIREQATLTAKWTFIIWAFGTLSLVTYFGVVMESTERRSPTPPDWSFKTRYLLRGARELMDEERLAGIGQAVDWARVHSFCDTIVQRCEDGKIEGKELKQVGQDGEEILIPGVGKAGLDISTKSWPWRSGYFEAIMGCALAAEHLDEKVLDTTNNVVYDKEFVVGPSNPDPRPRPHWMGKLPREEDVVPACAPPETYYMRILTGSGFSTKQKMDAARAYAHWLDFKGLSESADEMYRWAIDIAKSGLPSEVHPDDIIDSTTGVLKQNNASGEITSNLLRAATDMAIHQARNKQVSDALPILLSVVRARRAAPVSSLPVDDWTATKQGSGVAAIISSLLHGSQFPPPPPSGDEPFARHSHQPTCEDGELMLYIGEILYSTSAASDEGLGWTRQAVTIADGNLAKLKNHHQHALEKKRCKQCLLAGVSNWDAMLDRMIEQHSLTKEKKGWSIWVMGNSSAAKGKELAEERGRLDELKQRIVQQGIDEQIYGAV